MQVIGSGGQFPSSVAVHHDLVYVMNAGGEGSINGYRVDGDRLTPIAGSERSLGLDNTTPPFFLGSPGQIGITANGSELLVSAKGNGYVDAFALGPDGQPAATPVNTQTGPVPFGFVLDRRGQVVLTDASGSANTYHVLPSGALTPTGTAAANGQAATCWITEARGYFYATNTASNTITGYAETPHGQLSLLNASGVSASTDRRTDRPRCLARRKSTVRAQRARWRSGRLRGRTGRDASRDRDDQRTSGIRRSERHGGHRRHLTQR